MAVGHEQAQLIIDGKKSVITTCGSGMTAGVLWLGLKLLGVKNVALYDEVRGLTIHSNHVKTNKYHYSHGRVMLCDRRVKSSKTR